MGVLEQSNILLDDQFGFHQKRSADLQLLLTVHDLALSLDNRTQSDLDFSKAFDEVSHKLLLKKLKFYRITCEKLIGLNLSYLTVSSRLFVKALLWRLLVLPVEFLRALYWDSDVSYLY